MAYSIAGFYPDQRGAGVRIHTYTSTDAQATVAASGYFNSLDDILAVGDLIDCYDSTNNVNYRLRVDTNASSTVTTSIATQPGTIVSGSGATVSLTSAESGKTILMDRAAGIVFTLPSPVIGLKYKFVVTTAVTSNLYSIDTDGASTFLVGNVNTIIDDSGTSEGSAADGAAHVSLDMNGTTKGGLVGSWVEVECISSTQWAVSGTLVGSGTLVTVFA